MQPQGLVVTIRGGGELLLIKVKGQWYYLYRAVDKTGQAIDFLLTEQRDEQAAKRFLTKAIRRHGVPEKITIDGSAANEAAIKSYNVKSTAPRSPSARSSISTILWNRIIAG